MEQATQEQVQNFFDPSREKRRGVSFTRLRVTNRNTMNLPLPDGNIVPRGTHEICVYSDSVKFVKALVEDPALVARAREDLEAELLNQLMEDLRALPEKQYAEIDPEMVAERVKDRRDPKINDLMAHVLLTTEHSLEASFHGKRGRSIRPLDACEVLEDGIPEPHRVDQSAERDALVLAMSDVIAKTIAKTHGESGSKLDALAARFDKLEAENAELKRQLSNQNRKG